MPQKYMRRYSVASAMTSSGVLISSSIIGVSHTPSAVSTTHITSDIPIVVCTALCSFSLSCAP